MQKKTTFLRWAFFAGLIALGAYIAVKNGWLGYLDKDATRIPYVTLCAGALSTLYCGRLCWRLSGGRDPEDLEIDLEIAHYASSLCVSLGLLGTAIGYLIMFKEGAVDGSAKEVIRQTFSTASVAIVNTVCGAVCGILVEIQSQGVKYAVAKARKRAGKAS